MFNKIKTFCGNISLLCFYNISKRKSRSLFQLQKILVLSPSFAPFTRQNQKKMKNSVLIITLLLTISIPALSQNRSRVFDNFDMANGVRVVTKPTVKPIVYSRSTAKGKKINKKKSMNASEGIGLKKSSRYSYRSKFIMGSGKSMRGFTTGDLLVDSFIVDSCKRYNIDPLLIYAQMHQESAFKKRARSYKGASGLMQLMPATARRFGVTKIYDPKQNINAGVRYMRWLLNKFNGDVVLALAGYNAGEGAVMKYGYNVPPYRETREYVRRITKRYKSISNGTYLSRNVKKADKKQVAEIKKEKTKPLTIYEPEVLTVRLPDGRMRLVSK